jgi:hypothetical protein
VLAGVFGVALVGCAGAREAAVVRTVAVPPPAPGPRYSVAIVEDPRAAAIMAAAVPVDCRGEREMARRGWREYAGGLQGQMGRAVEAVAFAQEALAGLVGGALLSVDLDLRMAGGVRPGSTALEPIVAQAMRLLQGHTREARARIAAGDPAGSVAELVEVARITEQLLRGLQELSDGTRHVAHSARTQEMIDMLPALAARAAEAERALAAVAGPASDALTVDEGVRSGAIEPWDAFILIPVGPADPLAGARARANVARAQCGGAPAGMAAR